MSAGIRVVGVREVNAAFRKIDTSLARDFGNDLKRAATPVVDTARDKTSRWRGAKTNTIRATRAGPRVFVTQTARKTTGLRSDFGTLQKFEALVPALEENETEVFIEVEAVMNHYANRAGF